MSFFLNYFETQHYLMKISFVFNENRISSTEITSIDVEAGHKPNKFS